MKVSTTVSFLASLVAVVSAADCPPPGQTNAAGDYSCNPAHEYPGQACALIGDCYFLRGLGLLTSTTTSSSAQPTTTCPPPGQTNAAGDYSCNPAHEYPDQACALIGGCYFLRGLGLRNGTTTSSAPHPHATCPPPGETNAAGEYSCNPAHQYPGKACVLIGDCYFLRGLGGNVTYTSVHPASTTGAPVHTTIRVITSNGVPVSTQVITEPTQVVTAGAAQLSAVGGLAVLGLIAALL